MMEHGFYAPSRGYWQTNSDVPQRIIDTYPTDTIEVGLPPSERHFYNPAQGWVEDAEYDDKKLAVERESMVANAAQIQIALHDAGRLDQVEAIVAASSRKTQIWWRKGERIRRLSPVLSEASALMSPQPTPEWWDNLFRAAMELDV